MKTIILPIAWASNFRIDRRCTLLNITISKDGIFYVGYDASVINIESPYLNTEHMVASPINLVAQINDIVLYKCYGKMIKCVVTRINIYQNDIYYECVEIKDLSRHNYCDPRNIIPIM